VKRAEVLIVILAACAANASGRILYVDDDASPGGDGRSWDGAHAYLQDALADANAGPKPVEIRVAQGVYTPDRGAGVTAGDTYATFQLHNCVVLKGGYAGLAGVDPNARDIGLYETVLSGDLERNDPDVNDASELLHSQRGWNSRSVVTGSGTDRTAVLDGFTITGGDYPMMVYRIDPWNPPRFKGSGGGMNNLVGSPTIIRCTFVENMSFGGGGAICNVENSDPMIVECTFVRNHAFDCGGAVANIGGAAPTLTACTFLDNASGHEGGAVYSRQGSPVLEGCTFAGNAAWQQHGVGGAVCNEMSTCALMECRFDENGAGMGGALHLYDDSVVVVEQCVFVGNHADRGGAVSVTESGSSLLVSCCTFKGNHAGLEGGVLCDKGIGNQLSVLHSACSGNWSCQWAGALSLPNGTIAHCVFAGNRAIADGSISSDTGPGIGGAILNLAPREPLTITNCTFDQNWAGQGSAIYHTDREVRLSNCIVRGPDAQIYDCDEGWVTPVEYSCVEGGWPGLANVDMDPCFAEPGHWADPSDPNHPGDPSDPNSIWVDGDYHLKSQAGRWDPNSQTWVQDAVTSPCIDTGDPNSPVGYEPFPNGGCINMGAYGGTAEASKSYFGEPLCETIIAGDINGDCRVDLKDLGILLNHWLQSGGKAEE